MNKLTHTRNGIHISSAYVNVSISGFGWITPTLSYNKQQINGALNNGLSNLLVHKTTYNESTAGADASVEMPKLLIA